MKQKMINFLLSNANPSIRLRVKKEVLMDITAAEEQKLQNEILQEKIISLIAQSSCQAAGSGLVSTAATKTPGSTTIRKSPQNTWVKKVFRERNY